MPHDDFEVEIIDLDTLPEEFVETSPAYGDVGNNENDAEAILPLAVRVSLQSKLTLRQRVIRVIGLAVIFIVSLALILNSIVPIHNLLGLLVRPKPAATSVLMPNYDYFYLDASPPWGKLLLDGRPLAFSTVEPVQFPLGRHQFAWQAYPFRTIHCTLSVPVSVTDTCKHIAINAHVDISPSNALEVMFYDTLNMLSTTQQAALILAVQAGLDSGKSTTTVQPGEQFVHFVGSRTTEVATQPLHATLHFALSVGDTSLEGSLCANSYNIECDFLHRFQLQDVTQNCAWFCTIPNTYAPSPVPEAWQAVVIAHAYWDYTTLDGRPIAINQPDTVLNLTNSTHLVYLTIAWDGTRWYAAINTQEASGFKSFACLAASNEFDQMLPPVGINGFGFLSVSTAIPAIGCVEIVQSTAASPSSSSPIAPSHALCFYRFGIMLAANALARRYWPHMLVATAYEQSLARQLAAGQTP